MLVLKVQQAAMFEDTKFVWIAVNSLILIHTLLLSL